MKYADNIMDVIGRTPLVRLNRMAEGVQANIFVKLESLNPTGSVKDRIAFQMIHDAEQRGEISSKSSVIIEPTSGNTGIGLAMICAVKGYRLIIVMPDSMSMERRTLLKAFGAELVLTPADLGMSGAVKKAEEIAGQNQNYYMPQQFNNPANPKAHRETTAFEIWEDLDGQADVIVAGVGTGGTISGVAEMWKKNNPDIKIIAVEPAGSPVLSGAQPGPHKIQGIGAGFIPNTCRVDLIDDIFSVEDRQALEFARRLAQEEGILSGISSGANVFAALSIARRKEYKDKNIVTFVFSTGERYLSTELFDGIL